MPLPDILKALSENRLIPFIGAGMSAPCYPLWGKLIKDTLIPKIVDDTARKEALAAFCKQDFLYAAAVIQHALGENPLRGLLAETFKREAAANPQIAQARYDLLKGLPFRSIFTTNYDHFLHDLGLEVLDWPKAHASGCNVIKIHGSVKDPASMIFTPKDYARVRHSASVEDLFKSMAAGCSFLFLGYSLSDDNVRYWLERICLHMKQFYTPQHYALVKPADWSPAKRALYRELYSIECIDAELDSHGHPDIAAFLNQLRHLHTSKQVVPYATPQDLLIDKWYVDPEVSDKDDKDAPAESLDQRLDRWLADDKEQLLVLLGEFGTGKSTFAKRAVNRVLKQGKRKPVLIELRRSEFEAGAGPDDLARVAAPNAPQGFLQASEQGALVVILDAFDEMGKDPGQSLNESFIRLTRIVRGRAKVIVTSRKELFLDESKEPEHQREIDPQGKVIERGLTKLYLRLFDQPRVEQAFQKLGKTNIFADIEKLPRLMDLAKRPVLLKLIATYGRKFTAASKLSDLYETAITDMLQRGNDEQRGARRDFADDLAWRIQNGDTGAMPAAEVQALAISHNAEYADLFRSRTLLVRSGNDYAFGHPSFREYLVAKQVGRELKPCKLTDTTISFLRDLYQWEHRVEHGTGKYEGMVKIPAGRFIYGQGDKPGDACIKETTEDVWIDRCPVTNQQFLDFLRNSNQKDHKEWIDHERSEIKAGLKLSDPKYSDHPVVGITWHGATAYAASVGKHLPSEGQWEKAARGLDGREYPWGDGFVEGRANVDTSDTTLVKTFKEWPSPYGCLDMSGNVWEWTSSGERGTKILRGGAWYDYSLNARCASRFKGDPRTSDDNSGFRSART